MKRSFSLIVLLAATLTLSAQSVQDALSVQDMILNLFQEGVDGGQADAELYMEGYFKPALTGIGYGVSSGWFNTAKPHNFPGGDLTTMVTVAFVPDSERGFSMANASTFTSDRDPVPTLAGSADRPTFTVDTPGGPVNFQGLPGMGDAMNDAVGFVAIPVPMAQIGIGLPKGTELKIRYAPNIPVSGAEFKMYGFGVKHSIKQWLPGGSVMPFDLSAFVGYHKLDLRADIGTQNAQVQNGEVVLGFNSLTFQGIISKKLSVLTVYGAAGVSNTKLNLAVNGVYDVDNNGQFDPDNSFDVADPVDMQLALTGPRFNAGFRLQLAVVTIHADYALQKYNTLTVGFGFSFR